tara:strand:+ start:13904 stop:15661 length:1758 start_codon:yes stop_codon:yes gene_type:complete
MADENNINIANGLSDPNLPEPTMSLGTEGKQDTAPVNGSDRQVSLGGYGGVNWQEIAPTSFAERIDAVYGTGNPAGTMAWSVVSDIDGNPVLVTEDDRGQLQSIKTTPSHAATVLTQQSRYATAMEENAKAKIALSKKKNELKPQFKASLDEVDDPAYQALLRSRFEENPDQAMSQLVTHLQTKRRDEEKAIEDVQMQLENEALNNANQRSTVFTGNLQRGLTDANTVYQQSLNNLQANPDVAAANMTHAERKYHAGIGAATYGPKSGRQALLSPSSLGPMKMEAYKAWIKHLSMGGVDGTPYHFPHPTGDPTFLSQSGDMLAQLNSVAASLGWQGVLTQDDLPEIVTALNSYYNVHGEAIQIQTLQAKVDELQKQLDSNLPLNQDLIKADIEQAQSEMKSEMALDRNKDGVVESWERDAASPVETARADQVRGAHTQKRGEAVMGAIDRTMEAQSANQKKIENKKKEIDEIKDKLFEMREKGYETDSHYIELDNKAIDLENELKVLESSDPVGTATSEATKIVEALGFKAEGNVEDDDYVSALEAWKNYIDAGLADDATDEEKERYKNAESIASQLKALRDLIK